MKRFLAGLLAFCSCLSLGFAALPAALEAVAASSYVKMIVTNPGENASTQMNVGFHVPLGYTSCYVEYTTVDDTSWANAKTNNGTYKTCGASSSTNPFYGKAAKDDTGTNITQSMTFLDYNVNLTGLTPNTQYMYRIYDGSAYSDTYYFKTAANDGSSWSFLVTGDFHEYYKNYGVHRAAQATQAINAGISLAGQLGWKPVEHIVSVGDIVAWGVDYGQWQNVLDQSWIKNYSFANCIGNHDDMNKEGTSSSSAYNSVIFNHPLNGYNSGDEMGTVFYYVYNNVLFIYVNYLKASVAAQETWAQSVVDKMKGSYKYITLVNHRPATSKYSGTTYSYFWNYWADFCDKNHVDLVLAGDHHVYMRSQPIYNGSMVSSYSASNPNATVYIAADSSDGERGSSTDVKTFSSSWVKSSYYRYNYSSSTKDKTSIIINVGPDKMTTQFVYYENSSSASHPSWKQGSVSGHSSFYYGDVSYVYPYDHGYTGASPEPDPEPDPDDNGGLPLAKANFLSGGQYKYSTNVYPGGASYYSYEYYGDGSSQGGSFMTGKLNNGTLPADSNPGSSNAEWATFFLSQGDPQVFLKLTSAAYLNKIDVIYRNDGNFYGDAIVGYVGVSTYDGGYTTITDYTTSTSSVNGSNYKLTLTFTKPVNASYISLNFVHPGSPATRLALGEIEVWGDTTLPVVGSFELIDESDYTLDEENVTLDAPMTSAADVAAQFKCEVTVLDSKDVAVADTALVGTGCKVVRYSSEGKVLNSAIVVVSGDADGDAAITNTDYLSIKRKVKEAAIISDCYTKACDANTDGDITSVDILYMATYISKG
ncbi:MAG: fibronectin type III domain-containing protein [Clostridia bacterium]|nr:fibronectin type III domain-containing protein [Clostridia bacterium]